MSAKKIGTSGGGAGLSEGQKAGTEASFKELFLAVRAELDALYAKMDADSGDTGGDNDYSDLKATYFVA